MALHSYTTFSLSAPHALELAWSHSVAEPVPAQGLELVKALTEMAVQREGRPLYVCLLLDCWAGNPLAERLEAEFPEAAIQRCAIPHPAYQGRTDDAPCLVPLPQALWPVASTDTLSQSLNQDWLARWLYEAWESVEQRLVRQYFCGVLASRQSASHVAQHLARLGYQYPPAVGGQAESAAHLFRAQDPRVMQSVWPALTAGQQRRWLGPIQTWWSLQQIWGPWAFPDSESSTGAQTQTPAQACWVRMAQPKEEPVPATPVSEFMERLFNPEQWALAQIWPAAQQSWSHYRRRQIPVHLQPDGACMHRLLRQGLQAGLTLQELPEFVWSSWHITEPLSPEAASAGAVDWQNMHNAALLQQALHAYRQAPEQGLALYLEDLQAKLQHTAPHSS